MWSKKILRARQGSEDLALVALSRLDSLRPETILTTQNVPFNASLQFSHRKSMTSSSDDHDDDCFAKP